MLRALADAIENYENVPRRAVLGSPPMTATRFGMVPAGE